VKNIKIEAHPGRFPIQRDHRRPVFWFVICGKWHLQNI